MCISSFQKLYGIVLVPSEETNCFLKKYFPNSMERNAEDYPCGSIPGFKLTHTQHK